MEHARPDRPASYIQNLLNVEPDLSKGVTETQEVAAEQKDEAFEAAQRKLAAIEQSKEAERQLEEFAQARRALVNEAGDKECFLEYGSELEH